MSSPTENPRTNGSDETAGLTTAAKAFVKRVQIRNYKSIGNCVVALGPLTILVGRNGAGKTNFLDALGVVADGLQTSLDYAMKTRGGVDAFRPRSTGHPRNFSINLEINLQDGKTAAYGFEIGSQPEGGFFVKQERLRIRNARSEITAEYHVVEARLEKSLPEKLPPASRDRLYLVNAAGLPEFRGVYDELSAMGFYNLNPEAIKELQSPDAGELLHPDGSNIASVIGRLSNDQPKALARIKSYLKTIIPGITDLHRVGLGPRETLEFRQEVEGSAHPWKFYAASMSDGTLRALGTLVAVTQLAQRKRPVRLIGIEEPETALHPAAAGALMDALREAASHTQIVVTSHSPDLVEQADLKTDAILAVQSQQGTTEIGPIDASSRKTIKDHLYTAGELLRMDQLEVDRNDLKLQEQMELFSDAEESS